MEREKSVEETAADDIRRMARSGEFPAGKTQELLNLADELERMRKDREKG